MMSHSTKAERTCLCCGRTFPTKPARLKSGRGKYCSPACHNFVRRNKAIAHFWSQVRKTPGCWLWTGSTDRGGYGTIQSALFGVNRAHCFSWCLHFGPIPNGLDVLHTCDTPPCVRPDHLFTGTHAVNMKDMVMKGRTNGPRGIRNTNAKLSDSDVRAIRSRYAAGGVSQRALAAEFHVTQKIILGVVHWRLWRHVTA